MSDDAIWLTCICCGGKAVLRSNQGAVDSTIDQLLAMNMDNENEKIRQELDQVDQAELPSLLEAPRCVALIRIFKTFPTVIKILILPTCFWA